ncbi:MAG: HprK-related kinase B [Desulfonatronovibrio sp.]
MNRIELDFENYLQDIVRNREFPYDFLLSLDDCVIMVKTNSSGLKNILVNYFQTFVVSENQQWDITVKALETSPVRPGLKLENKMPESGKKRIKEQYADLNSGRIIRKKLTSMLFYFNSQDNLAIGQCEKNHNQVINFINSRFIQWKLDQGCLLCHAAAVANKKLGLILAGFSGMGKSTLALHQMNQDLTFVSNDRLMVEKTDSGLRMFGVPKLPRVNPGTILNNPSLISILSAEEHEKFREIDPAKIWEIECKYDVFLDECFGPGKFNLSSGVAGLVILNWQRTGQPTQFRRVDLANRPDLLETVMKSPGLFYVSEPETKPRAQAMQTREYIELLSSCPVYEISGGIDFVEASRKCCELIA